MWRNTGSLPSPTSHSPGSMYWTRTLPYWQHWHVASAGRNQRRESKRLGSGGDGLRGDKWLGDYRKMAGRGGTERDSLAQQRNGVQNSVDLREKKDRKLFDTYPLRGSTDEVNQNWKEWQENRYKRWIYLGLLRIDNLPLLLRVSYCSGGDTNTCSMGNSVKTKQNIKPRRSIVVWLIILGSQKRQMFKWTCSYVETRS